MKRRGAKRPTPPAHLELHAQVAYLMRYAHQPRSEIMTWSIRTLHRMTLLTSQTVARENGDA